MTEPPKGLERLTTAIKKLFSETDNPSLPDCSKQKQEFVECMKSLPKNYYELHICKDLFTKYRTCSFPERKE